MTTSAADQKIISAPPCTNPEAPVVLSEGPTPAAAVSLGPKDPTAATSPGRSSEGMAGLGCHEDERSEGSLRERLERHRSEMAGRVRVPDAWGQEPFLQSWVHCPFERFLPEGLALARAALVVDCRQASPQRLVDDCGRSSAGRMEIVNRC